MSNNSANSSRPGCLSRLKARGEISLKMANGGEFATSMRNRWIGSVSDGRETSRGVYGRRSLRCASVAKQTTYESLLPLSRGLLCLIFDVSRVSTVGGGQGVLAEPMNTVTAS